MTIAVDLGRKATKPTNNQPKEEGIAACREALETRTAPLIPTEYVLEMIKTVLENNTFKFGDHNYKQTEGIAIGSRLGRNFACSYMRIWDEELIKYDRPMFYKRYIDDRFGIWTGSLQSLQEFARYANNILSSIQIELRYSQEKIEFLDTWVKLENGRVYTNLYKKPSDKQLYLKKKFLPPFSYQDWASLWVGITNQADL